MARDLTGNAAQGMQENRYSKYLPDNNRVIAKENTLKYGTDYFNEANLTKQKDI